MIDLTVSIEIHGRQVNVGSITGSATDDASFSYAKEYLASENCRPISISLPLREEAFSANETRNFFEALLPEGFTRRTVAGWLRVDEGDYLSILRELGRECIGAIKISDTFTQEEDTPEYIELSPAQLKELASEGTESSAKFITRSRISLAGASGKTGLYFDDESGKWYMPLGDAPLII